MYPIICKIGPFTIYSYGFMLVLAFILSLNLAKAKAQKQGVKYEIIFNLSFIAFTFGIIGARILYVMQNISYYIKNPLEVIMLQHGGLSWFGGLIFGSSIGIIYIKRKNLPVYKICDLVMPFVALAQSIGRVGCFLNGCCYGKSGIPTQVYSSLILILIFIALRFLQERPHKEGQIFFAYLLLYSAKRFFMEFLRGDSEIIFLGLTLFQFISIALFLLASLKLISLRKSRGL